MIYNKLYANSMSFLVQFVNRLIAHLTQCKCYIFSCPNSQVTLTTKALGNSLSKMSSQVCLYQVLSVRCGEVPTAIYTTQQSVTSRLETSRYRDFSQCFESIGLGLESFGLEKKSRYRSQKHLVSKKSLGIGLENI